MDIKLAQWIKSGEDKEHSIALTIGEQIFSVPKDPNNRHYAEIIKQVEEGKLTIKDAD
jgi:hypothetical protein|tara:strand:+ start:420 stop:593 length:174 start_codon:yes stop_codon:yes gene_type:complete